LIDIWFFLHVPSLWTYDSSQEQKYQNFWRIQKAESMLKNDGADEF